MGVKMSFRTSDDIRALQVRNGEGSVAQSVGFYLSESEVDQRGDVRRRRAFLRDSRRARVVRVKRAIQ